MKNLKIENLHKKFSDYGKNAKLWMRKCVLMLPEIERERVWEKKGFSSIYEYAAKLAGMSRNTVNEALRVLRRVEDKPSLMKVVVEKGINAVKPVVSVAGCENERFWAEKARNLSMHALETYVREVKKAGGLQGLREENGLRAEASSSIFPQEKAKLDSKNVGYENVSMELEREVREELEKLKGKGSWNELMKELLRLRREKLEEEKPEKVATGLRHIPVNIKNFVGARTNGQCEFPGCFCKAAIFHHTERFALKKEHDPSKIVVLCKSHERLVHAGLVENEQLAPKFWKIKRQPDIYDYKNLVDHRVQKFRAPE